MNDRMHRNHIEILIGIFLHLVLCAAIGLPGAAAAKEEIPEASLAGRMDEYVH